MRPTASVGLGSDRANAIKVIPVCCAMRSAIVVGAEIATRIGIPIVAAFCTISKLQRLVITVKPAAGSNLTPRHGSDLGFWEESLHAHRHPAWDLVREEPARGGSILSRPRRRLHIGKRAAS